MPTRDAPVERLFARYRLNEYRVSDFSEYPTRVGNVSHCAIVLECSVRSIRWFINLLQASLLVIHVIDISMSHRTVCT